MGKDEQRINELVVRLKRELKGLAQAWIVAGVQQFALVNGSHPGQIVCHYPEDAIPVTEWAFCAPIPFSKARHLRLCVSNLPFGCLDGCTAMLEANAKVIAGFIEREWELDVVTNEVVQNQDLVLALYDLNNTLSRPLELAQMLEALLEHMCRLTDAVGGVGLLMHPTRLEQQRNTAFSSDELDGYFSTLNKQASRVSIPLADGRSLLLLPLIMPEKGAHIDGMIGLMSDAPMRSPQIKLAKAVIEQAGTHFQNIVHFEERVLQARIQTELELARSIQTRLLPNKPMKYPGLDVWGESRPAFDVGGDFFDFFTAPNTSLVFSLGDVSGKGLSAALVMTMARTAIRSAAAFAPSPLTIMKLANRNLYDDFTELDKLTTVFIGKADQDFQRITFANAGHSPVAYADSTTRAALVEADAPPLGVLPSYLGGSSSIELPVGGVLIVATDGFVEAENEQGEMVGYTRFLTCVDDNKHLNAAQIAHALYDMVTNFRGSTLQNDDQTIVVIKRVCDAETPKL
ncbi:MAG: PP2C family protein-serine/threonine phosphatase [Anaerolineae bacterium]